MELNIILFLLLVGMSTQGNTTANHKAADAYLRYTGIDKEINNVTKRLEKQVPNEIKVYLIPGVTIAQSLVEHKVILKWSFP